VRRAALCFTLPLLLFATGASAVSDPREMLLNRPDELRAEALGRQLRCLVCQNESIEASDADLARDLRHIIRDHVKAGESDRKITDWMVARYGTFIRLRPPFDAQTLLLWLAPVLALAAGAVGVLLLWRRGPEPPAPLTGEERRRLARLIGRRSLDDNRDFSR
jgi:cytochrome c-type biogenesis protein CcmH